MNIYENDGPSTGNMLSDPIKVFPNETLNQIFRRLSPVEWLKLKSVSRSWNDYLSFDDHLWKGRIDLADDSINCNRKLLENCVRKMANAYVENSRPTKYLSIAPRSEFQLEEYLQLLSSPNPIGNFAVQELVINGSNMDSTAMYKPSGLLYTLIQSQKLTIDLPSSNIRIGSIIKSQPILEYFQISCNWFLEESLPFEEEETFERFKLKSLIISTKQQDPSATLKWIRNCSNLQHLEYYPTKLIEDGHFDEELFSNINKCNIQSLKLKNIYIKHSGKGPLTEIFGSWPETLESLTMSPCYWQDFNLVSGTLENLKQLTIDMDFRLEEFFYHYKIGKHLTSLTIDISFLRNLQLWELCTNVENLTITSIGRWTGSSVIDSIINRFPNLKTISLPEDIEDELLQALFNKKQLKTITLIT